MTMIPTIHLNGTRGEDLLEQNEAAAKAVQAAINAVCEAAPNGRDYYPQGNTAPGAASEEHGRHVRALVTVRDDLLAKCRAIADQLEIKSAARIGGK